MELQYVVYIYLYCVCRNVTASNYFAVVNGNISDAALLTNASNIGALPACAKRCEGPECVSFTYNADAKVCSTYSTGLSISSEPFNTGSRYFQKAIEGGQKFLPDYPDIAKYAKKNSVMTTLSCHC